MIINYHDLLKIRTAAEHSNLALAALQTKIGEMILNELGIDPFYANLAEDQMIDVRISFEDENGIFA